MEATIQKMLEWTMSATRDELNLWYEENVGYAPDSEPGEKIALVWLQQNILSYACESGLVSDATEFIFAMHWSPEELEEMILGVMDNELDGFTRIGNVFQSPHPIGKGGFPFFQGFYKGK